MQKIISPGLIEFSENRTKTIELETGSVFNALYLTFDYLILENGLAPDDRRPFGSILELVKEIKITINDTDDVLRMTGAELMAVYISDHGRRPDTTGLVGTEQALRQIFPINHWCTNTEILAYTAHDYRKAGKVVLSITWGDINDLWITEGNATIDQMLVNVTQQGVQKYQSPLTGKLNRRNKPARYNPAVRFFNRTQEKFLASKNNAEIGRLEKTSNPMWSKGAIIFAEAEGLGVTAARGSITGDITLVQGTETLARFDLDILRASMETVKALPANEDVIYIPFSGLMRSVEIEQMHKWKDDIIVYADMEVADEPITVTVLSDGFRQERLK